VLDRITQAMGMERRSLRGSVGTGGIGWWSRLRATGSPAPGRANQGSNDVPQGDNP
jgi:hypothetical protein